MGTGRSEDTDLAAYLPPAAQPAMPSALRAAARESVVVVLGEDAGDADAIWDFIRQRMTGNTGLM
jgi:hypothetical protein